ncbi:hypothetical protein AADG42_10505 [Ammonicoccus fulvus]|uniref:Uncharacterized protein n=1 Tax=Ammonicoccus fulvus TaxID=3138240 RepID=A0ABZ3FSF7_9ACTN
MTRKRLPVFDQRDDRDELLAEILRCGRPHRGLTLIAHLHLETLEVLGVRRVRTPEPPPEDAVVNYPLAKSMSPILRDIATDMVRGRDWLGEDKGWRPPNTELITIVCRDGDPVITHAETQYFWGWRYANHCTMAFDSDVYAMTPSGWAGLIGGTGSTPILGRDDPGPVDDALIFPPLREDLMYPDDEFF